MTSPLLDSHAMARVLSHENTTSDLLVALIRLDPSPLVRFLGLSTGNITAHRERVVGNGRIDIEVTQDGLPAAWFEVKIGASSHGDQLDDYQEAAKDSRVQLFVMAPNPVRPAFLSRYEQFSYLSLAQFCSLWASNELPAETQWFARSLQAVFERWGDPTLTFHADMPVTQLRILMGTVRNLMISNKSFDKYFLSSATSVNGPNPAVYLFKEINQDTGSWAVFDARARLSKGPITAREQHSDGLWDVRVGIEVAPSATYSDGAAQEEWAFRLIDQVSNQIELKSLPKDLPLRSMLSAPRSGYKSLSGEKFYRDIANRRRTLKFVLDLEGRSTTEFSDFAFALLDHCHLHASQAHELLISTD